ncbi:hypothetical protein [Mesorhizobium sp. CAU 1732]|uniref:hypothetical protein n=1 Tax=Mesorhizobium sp. CAU 1732 TaxID=3140358 RepID=UPI00325FFA49
MPNFNVSWGGLFLRPALQSELLPEVKGLGGRPQTFDYMQYRSGPRQVGARNATGGGVAAVVQAASLALNERALTVALSRWLRQNHSKISDTLFEKRHDVFVVQVNYTTAKSMGNTVYMGGTTHLLGTVPTHDDIKEILTDTLLYGPQSFATPLNRSHSPQRAFLIGQRQKSVGEMLEIWRNQSPAPR